MKLELHLDKVVGMAGGMSGHGRWDEWVWHSEIGIT